MLPSTQSKFIEFDSLLYTAPRIGDGVWSIDFSNCVDEDKLFGLVHLIDKSLPILSATTKLFYC